VSSRSSEYYCFLAKPLLHFSNSNRDFGHQHAFHERHKQRRSAPLHQFPVPCQCRSIERNNHVVRNLLLP
jgi:hypothetical protein